MSRVYLIVEYFKKETAMNKDKFISKKEGLIIARLNPEQFFKRKFNYAMDYYHHVGLMHGELLMDELQYMENYLPTFLVETRGKLMGKMAYRVLINRARAMRKYIEQKHLIEIEGVAKGAGVDPDFVLLINVFDELKNCQSNLWIVPTLLNLGDSGGCSALAVEAAKDCMNYGMITDYVVFGHILGRTNTVFIYQNKFGPNFVVVGWPGYVGLIRGMNEQGTVLISVASYSKEQTIKGIANSFLYRQVIESNDPSLIERAPRTIGGNILIGNKEDANVIEVSTKELDFRGCLEINNRKFITMTNYYQTPRLSKSQRKPALPPGSTIPPNEVEDWFWGFFGLNGSIKRNNTLKIAIQDSKEFFPETIKKILAKVASPYTTLNFMVFDPANLELYIANNNGKMPATDGELVKINVGNLWKL